MSTRASLRDTSHRRWDRHRITKTAFLLAPRVEVRCASPVALHLPPRGEHRGHLPPRPDPRGCGRLRTPGDCWRRVSALAACGLLGEGLLAVPTPWPPVARWLLADPQDMSTPDGGGSGQRHLWDPVARTPPPEPVCREAGGVCRGHRSVAGQPHWPEHQRRSARHAPDHKLAFAPWDDTVGARPRGRHQHGVYTLWMNTGIRSRTGSPPKPCPPCAPRGRYQVSFTRWPRSSCVRPTPDYIHRYINGHGRWGTFSDPHRRMRSHSGRRLIVMRHRL